MAETPTGSASGATGYAHGMLLKVQETARHYREMTTLPPDTERNIEALGELWGMSFVGVVAKLVEDRVRQTMEVQR